MTDSEQIGHRLNEVLNELAITQTVFAQQLNIQQSYLSNVFNGRKGIGMTILVNITKIYPNLNIHWLVTGKGQMWIGADPDDPPQPASASQVQEPPARKYEKALPDTLRQALADQERRITRLENVVFPKTKGK